MFLLIVLMVGLVLNHLFTQKIGENFDNGVIQVDINSDQNNLVYQNAGEIKQQEKTITDFQAAIDNEIKDLTDRVTAFQKIILTNKTNIGKNATAIRSSTREIKTAAQAKQAKLDKAGSGMDASK